jgi:hypothetical protein
LAFAIASAEFSNWEAWLAEKGITMEEKKKWDLGGWSLYLLGFRWLLNPELPD